MGEYTAECESVINGERCGRAHHITSEDDYSISDIVNERCARCMDNNIPVSEMKIVKKL